MASIADARARFSNSTAPARRVALVTRVSTPRQASNDEGSLKNQLHLLRLHLDYMRERGEDWQEASLYQLPPVSGKLSLRTDEMQRLRADIAADRVNTVLCTRIARASRNAVEFLQLIEYLNEYEVEFVSLREQVDTTTPYGKLILRVLISLAEFEREETAERTRDAMAIRAERGLWNGGQLLGLDLDPERKGYPVVNAREAETVRFAFETYHDLGSYALTVEELTQRGYRTKAFMSRNGREHPGKRSGSPRFSTC